MLMQVIASSIPIPESQPATPPVSPFYAMSYSPQSPGREGSEHTEQLDYSDSD